MYKNKFDISFNKTTKKWDVLLLGEVVKSCITRMGALKAIENYWVKK